MPPDQTLMTTREVADALGVGVATVTRWAKDGLLPSIVLPSGRRRYRRTDVDQLLADDEVSA